MSILAIVLAAIGIGDLHRGVHSERLVRAGVATLASLAALAALAGINHPAGLALLGVGAVAALCWQQISARALRSGHGEIRALAVVLGVVLLLVLGSGWAEPTGGLIHRWVNEGGLTGLHGARADTVLLAFALALVQLSTGNVIVRLALGTTDALLPEGQPQPADHLKGGRLLGALERLFILGLGLSGQLTAASLVIAAKGLLRFPELTTKRDDAETKGVGIDTVTEYFLVGSFLSWLLAAASVALVTLA